MASSGDNVLTRRTLPRMGARLRARGGIGPALVGFGLPFVLVLYFALRGGGYDAVVRGEIGIAVWWIVLIGAAVGALPATRVTRAGWIAVGLLTAFAVWTTLAISWSESAERSAAEMGRVALYLGVLVLALLVQGRDGLRRAVFGVGAAIAVVGVLAVLSRLHPSWFPPNETARIFEGLEARLSYPLGYWNGVATLLALGVPLLLVVAERARMVAVRALAAAALPVLALGVFFTLSRGGALELAIGLVALLALYPRRLALLPALILGAVGAALLVVAASQRDALEAGLSNELALRQGDEMLGFLVVVSIGVGLLYAAWSTAVKHGFGPDPERIVSRRATAVAWAATLAIATAVALAAGVGGFVSDSWEEFSTPAPETNDSAARFESLSGSGRVDLWRSALGAYDSSPVLGIGSGSYEFWWARDEENNVLFARDAHSLYLETLAELGVVGLALLLALIALLFAGSLRRLVRARDESRRAFLAAATAGLAVFFSAAAIDWVWELTVLPVVALLLAAATLGPDAKPRSGSRISRFAVSSRSSLVRLGLVVMGVAGLVAIAIPLAGASALRDSEAAVQGGELPVALEETSRASDVQPYAASPELQRAMVLELDGDIPGAIAAAEAAVESESTNWRNWLVLSRLQAKAGNAEASVEAYRKARDLNPNSPLFQPTPEG